MRLNPSEGGSAGTRTKKQGHGNTTGGREVPISRRQFVSPAAGAGIASVVAPRLTLAQNSGPIRIGLLAAKTGPLASGGIDMELALTMFLKEHDNTLAGRKVELIVADTAGTPATARTKAQELVEKNDIHCIIGPLAAFEALAIADYLTEKEIPTIGVAAAEDMTQRHPSPWFVRDINVGAMRLPAGRLCRQGTEIQEDRNHRRRLCLRARNVRRFPARVRGQWRQDHSKDLHATGDTGLRQLCRAGEKCGCDLPWHRRLERIPLPSPIYRIWPEGQDGRDRRHDGAR